MTLAYVASGRLDAFLEKDAAYAWDIAGGLLLIEEARGRLTDFDGGPPNLGRGIANVIANNGTSTSLGCLGASEVPPLGCGKTIELIDHIQRRCGVIR